MARARRLIIIGSGGHALSVWDAAVSAGFTVEAFLDSRNEGGEIGGTSVITRLPSADLGDVSFALGVGAGYAREEVMKELVAKVAEARFPPVVHSSAYISPDSRIEDGVVVLSHAHVGPGCVLGLGAVVNTGSSLDHHSTLGEFATLSPGARTGGGVHIGNRSMVGLNSGVLEGVTVEEDSVIGALSMVNRNIPSNSVAYGNPCVVVRERARDEPYFSLERD